MNYQYLNRFITPNKRCVEVNDLDENDKEIVLACTQLSDDRFPTQGSKNRVLKEWITYLEEHPTQFESLYVSTRVNQKLFNALCKQTNLKSLYLKWGTYPDLSEIKNLIHLERLYLSAGASLKDLSPLQSIPQLHTLALSAVGAHDHSPLASLVNLKHLRLDSGMDNILTIDNLYFLEKLNLLESFITTGFRISNHDYSPILNLKHLKYLSVNMSVEDSKEWNSKLVEAFPNIEYNFHKTLRE